METKTRKARTPNGLPKMIQQRVEGVSIDYVRKVLSGARETKSRKSKAIIAMRDKILNIK
ncbi:hypothetical protein NTJ28_001649 [Flavobacterium psychrophilum]|nr:hypothetical protein [Flavobacterium psychrophilum]EKT4510508.1 hypothetical protein [Flavobacterium psychrophilum]